VCRHVALRGDAVVRRWIDEIDDGPCCILRWPPVLSGDWWVTAWGKKRGGGGTPPWWAKLPTGGHEGRPLPECAAVSFDQTWTVLIP